MCRFSSCWFGRLLWIDGFVLYVWWVDLFVVLGLLCCWVVAVSWAVAVTCLVARCGFLFGICYFAVTVNSVVI